MGIDPKQYEKLPGRRWFSLAEQNSLYLGEDHLLIVSREYCCERYRRVRYAHIQSLQMARSPLGLGASVLMAGLLMLLAINWMSRNLGAGAVGIIGITLGGIWLVWGLDGRLCTVTLRTAVEDIPLRSLAHERAALRALERIEARARRTQDTEPAPGNIASHAPEAYAVNDRIASLGLRREPAPAATPYDPGPHAVALGAAAAAGMLCVLLAWTGEGGIALSLLVLCCGIGLLAGLIGGQANRRATVPQSIRIPERLSVMLCLLLGSTAAMVLLWSLLVEMPLDWMPMALRNIAGGLAVAAFAVSVPGLAGMARYRRHYIPPLRPTAAGEAQPDGQPTPPAAANTTPPIPPGEG